VPREKENRKEHCRAEHASKLICERGGRNKLLLLYKACLSIVQVLSNAYDGVGNGVTIAVAGCQHPSNEGVYWQTAHRDAGFDYSDIHWFSFVL